MLDVSFNERFFNLKLDDGKIVKIFNCTMGVNVFQKTPKTVRFVSLTAILINSAGIQFVLYVQVVSKNFYPKVNG